MERPTDGRPTPAAGGPPARAGDEVGELRRCLGSQACDGIEHSGQPMAFLNLDGQLILANPAFSRLVGYPIEDLTGRRIVDLTPPRWADQTREVMDRVLRDGQPVRYEKEYRARDGRLVPVEIVADVFRDESGRPIAFSGLIADLTERKQMEAALVAAERRARALFEGINDAVFVHDLDGRILEANPAATRLLGYSHDEFLALTTQQIDAEEFAGGFKERLGRQLEEGHLACDGRHRAKDGRVIPVEINTSRIELEDRPAVMAVIRDVTERRALEETRRQFVAAQARNAAEMAGKNRALAESEARHRMLMEASLDAVVVADAEATITLFNPAAERVFGHRADEAIGRPLSLLLPGPAATAEALRLDLGRPDPDLVGKTAELTGRRKSGEEFPLELSLSAVEPHGRTQYFGAIRDLTERQRLRALVEQSERLASIGLLSAGVAHEINNPLAYVANNLAVLERDLKGVGALLEAYERGRPTLAESAPELLAHVDRVAEDLDWNYVRENLPRLLDRTRDGVRRVASIVQNLRTIARTGPTHKEEVPLSELIDSALEMAQGQLKRAGIRVELDVPPGLPKLPCVPQQITQVLLNLVINAAQAIQGLGRPDGGLIRVLAGRLEDSQWFEIADDGGGIPSENLSRLFDPFFTTKPVGEGTGLGLAISHGIVSGHGGTIEVRSRDGFGTTFRVSLPERAGAPPRVHAAAPA